MIYCTKCGKQNPITAKFCTGCGVAIATNILVQTEKKANKKGRFIIAMAALLVLGSGVYFIFFNKKNKSDSNISSTSKGIDTPNPNPQSSLPESSSSTSNNTLSYTDINGLFVYRSDCFVIVNGSYTEEANAINAVNSMKASGYNNAGYFWRPNFPSVNDKYLYSTFIGTYQTYNECEKDLRVFKQTNAYWYGIKISYNTTRVEIR